MVVINEALSGGGGPLCPPSEFRGLVIRRHFSSFMSPFQSCVTCRNFTLTGSH